MLFRVHILTIKNQEFKIQNSTIDYHCHLLSGLDDGSKSLAESLAMARLLAAAGFSEICCTPHRIRGVWDNSAAVVRTATAALQAELELAGIPLTLYPAAEYYLDEFLPEALDDPLPLPGNMLLVELPTTCDSHLAQRIMAKIVLRGLIPMIAHPERCHLLEPVAAQAPGTGLLRKLFGTNNKSPDTGRQSPLLQCLEELGCQFQGNLGSLLGHYGARVRQNALNLQSAGWYSHWGSDAHNVGQLTAVLHGSL